MNFSANETLEGATRRVWDVAVVGAGPAGALAAYGLARRGAAVLLVDQATFPRWKVCGCCLNDRALFTLRTVGLGELPARWGARPLKEMRLAARNQSACIPLRGVALSRGALDAALVQAAVQAGTVFLPGTHATLGEETGLCRSLLLRGKGAAMPVPARLVLAADGLGGKLLARAGLDRASPEPGARIGAGAIVEEVPSFYEEGKVFMACGPGGYLGLVRLEDGRLNLAAALDAALVRAVGNPGRAAYLLLKEVDWPIPPRLQEAVWRGTPALSRQPTRLAAPRVFVIGDAAGYVEPFTGEGMAWALASGAAVVPLALQATYAWRPEWAAAWTTLHRRILGRRLACRIAAAVLRHPLLARALIALLATAPALASPVLRHLNSPLRNARFLHSIPDSSSLTPNP